MMTAGSVEKSGGESSVFIDGDSERSHKPSDRSGGGELMVDIVVNISAIIPYKK